MFDRVGPRLTFDGLRPKRTPERAVKVPLSLCLIENPKFQSGVSRRLPVALLAVSQTLLEIDRCLEVVKAAFLHVGNRVKDIAFAQR